MIEYLRIHNLALISDMELEFSTGLNVLTGETGAGKSFILKALNFITGEKLTSDMVRNGCERAQVEALFTLPDKELVIKRELIAETGRSRFFINDNLASQETVKSLRPHLILHVSQHGQQKIALPSSQIDLVDSFMNDPAIFQERDTLIATVKDMKQRKQALLDKIATLSEKRDLLEMQLTDINKVNPQPNEEEELEEAHATIRVARQKKAQNQRMLSILQGDENCGLIDLLGQCERELDHLIEINPEFSSYLDTVTNTRNTLIELSTQLRKNTRLDIKVNPESIEARLYEFAQLKRKLKKNMDDILIFKVELEKNLSFLDESNLDISNAEREEKNALKKLNQHLKILNEKRTESAQIFCSALESKLRKLGFSKQVKVIPKMIPFELFENCVELRPRLLWAPNPGQNPQPLDRIASGGELSRFLLSVISIFKESDPVTLIFDEVDSGIGGITLNRVGEHLEELANSRQILLITHWPHIAKRAKTHFRVTKSIEGNQTFTRCKSLNGYERKSELKRMAGIENENTLF